MILVYINKLGPDYKDESIFEFIFSDNEDVFGEDWDMMPSSGRAKPPDLKFIRMVGTLADTELNLELIQNSDYFSVMDGVDGVVALGWECYDDDVAGPGEGQKRLVFRFGEKLEDVVKKLNQRNLSIKQQKIK